MEIEAAPRLPEGKRWLMDHLALFAGIAELVVAMGMVPMAEARQSFAAEMSR